MTAQDKDAYLLNAAKLTSLRGDVWVQLRTPKHQLGFSSQIWVKVDPSGFDEVRMEIVGPLGADLGLLLLYVDQKTKKSILLWIDYERGTTERFVDYWYDIPLRYFGHVLAGGPVLGERVAGWDENSGVLKVVQGRWEFEHRWRKDERFNRDVLSSIEGKELRDLTKVDAHDRTMSVHFREFERYGDFFLPKEIDVSSSLSILLNMTWRTRHWNESLPAEAFLPPK